MSVVWARFEGIGMVTRGDVEDLIADRRKLKRLQKLVLAYDKDWHGAMWDGQCVDPKEVTAWDKIVKAAGKKA